MNIFPYLKFIIGKHHQPKLKKCHELGGDQEWNHRLSNDDTLSSSAKTITAIYNMAAGLCLGLSSDLDAGIMAGDNVLTMHVCNNENSHMWNLQTVPDSEL